VPTEQCPPQEELEFKLRGDRVRPSPKKALPTDITSKWFRDNAYCEDVEAIRVCMDSPFGPDIVYTDCEITDPLTRLGLLTGGIQKGTNEFKPLAMDENGRLCVDAEISIQDVNLDVQLTRKDDNPLAGDVHDAVRIGNQDYELAFKPDCEAGKGEARVVDTLHCGGVNKIITLTGSVQEVKVAATAKADRKTVFMRPLTGKARWGFQNDITDDDAATGGDPLFKRQPAEITAEANTSVYIIGSAGVKVFVAEA